jgi:hypothetical protein
MSAPIRADVIVGDATETGATELSAMVAGPKVTAMWHPQLKFANPNQSVK